MAESSLSTKSRRNCFSLAALVLAASTIGFSPGAARAQGSAPATSATIDTTLEAGEADAVAPRRRLVKWNEYDGPISSLRLGYGFVYDWASYTQDDASRQQFSMPTDNGLRDFRVLVKGRFKTKRPVSWTLGYMYDGNEKEWHFRQTGFQVDVPEVSGRFFLGRTKEGYSQAKVMVGYYILSIERSQSLDAFVPILADGIKYMGYYPRQRVFLDAGYFWDAASEQEKFAIDDNQVVARLGWQPILSDADKTVLHVAVMARSARPDEGKIRFKSKPGAWLAPNFLDTGTLTGDRANTFGVEANYRKGSWLFASEYDWQGMELATGGSPTFHGGEVSASWLITGEVRPYNKVGGFYQQVTPTKSIFDGGRGALETTFGFTYSDFDAGSIDGGKFWRFTPMARWYMSEQFSFVGAYGYGELDRFGIKGRTQFFQLRFVSML